jgi:hypothetical protein
VSYGLASAATPIVPPSGSGLIRVFYTVARPARVSTTNGPIVGRS